MPSSVANELLTVEHLNFILRFVKKLRAKTCGKKWRAHNNKLKDKRNNIIKYIKRKETNLDASTAD